MAQAGPQQIKRLTDVRNVMLRLHKALLDAQRAQYEHTHGPVASAGEVLQLVISDPDFDWLHRFSELIVAIDEATDGGEPLTEEIAMALLGQSRALLPAESNAKYAETLRSNAHASMIHQELATLLDQN